MRLPENPFWVNLRTTCVVWLAIFLNGTSPVHAELCVGNYHSEEDARRQLARFSSTFSSAAEWEARAAKTRAQILNGCGLSPLPAKTPLNPIKHSLREYDGYQVESIALEAVPGFFVYGTLYSPGNGSTVKRPAILCPHGHGKEPNGGGRYRPANQQRCATLARMGAIVFSYDMLGYGDSGKNGWTHRTLQAMPLQLWSSIRIVDYLESRDDVDPKRIAVTGASGGGTQTFLLTAVDDRIAVSVPTVMVSAHFFGGCVCESGHPVHKTEEHETNNVDIAACAAPRPQMLISVGGDWTKNTPHVEFPYLQSVYRLYGAEANVENHHLADEQHDYNLSKQMGMYPFMAKHLGLDSGQVDMSKVTIEPHEKMQVFDAVYPLPTRAVKPDSDVVKLLNPR